MEVLEEVRLSVDELEALRLKDLMRLEQEEAAQQMGVSRQTFQRMIEDAHQKVAESLVKGKALTISGGDYQLVPAHLRCGGCEQRWQQLQGETGEVGCPNCKRRALGASMLDDGAVEGEPSGTAE
jgi:predicted DNA-binding protein (UPF0251 family)